LSSSNQTHFEWFSIPRNFDIDLRSLRAKYLDLQKQLHPDKSAGLPDANQSQAIVLNTRLNDAYDSLKDPVKRAIYLLELSGVEYDADRQTQNDPIYLMQQLEIREELGDLEVDSPHLDESLDKFRSLALSQLEQYSEEFSLAYDKADWPLSCAAIGRMMFAGKLMRDVNEREEQLLDL
jgi:molecular chaperone HscB